MTNSNKNSNYYKPVVITGSGRFQNFHGPDYWHSSESFNPAESLVNPTLDIQPTEIDVDYAELERRIPAAYRFFQDYRSEGLPSPITQADAEQVIEAFRSEFPKLASYMESLSEE